MSVEQDHYEALLATFCHHHRAVELLRHHRPYFEKIPSIRRSGDSIITIPLPVVQVRQRLLNAPNPQEAPYELIPLPADLAILMCDPEWQIKSGVEVFVFIHLFGEGLYDLLRRWRETQVALSRGYHWEMPLRYQHIFSEGADKQYPLFVLSPYSSTRIQRGLQGAYLPHVVMPGDPVAETEPEAIAPSASDPTPPADFSHSRSETDGDAD